MNRVDEALKWLRIEESALLSGRDRVLGTLRTLAMKEHRPIKSSEIGRSLGLAPRTVREHLGRLLGDGRVAFIAAKGWIPLLDEGAK